MPQDKEYILELLEDVCFYMKQGSNWFFYNVEARFGRSDVTYDDYFNIL